MRPYSRKTSWPCSMSSRVKSVAPAASVTRAGTGGAFVYVRTVTTVSRPKPNAITRMTAWRHQGDSGFSDGSVDISGCPLRDAVLAGPSRAAGVALDDPLLLEALEPRLQEVAAREDADQPARLVRGEDGKTADSRGRHPLGGLPARLVGTRHDRLALKEVAGRQRAIALEEGVLHEVRHRQNADEAPVRVDDGKAPVLEARGEVRVVDAVRRKRLRDRRDGSRHRFRDSRPLEGVDLVLPEDVVPPAGHLLGED